MTFVRSGGTSVVHVNILAWAQEVIVLGVVGTRLKYVN